MPKPDTGYSQEKQKTKAKTTKMVTYSYFYNMTEVSSLHNKIVK